MHQIWKKKNKVITKVNGKEETVLEFDISNTRPNIPHVYGMNIANAETS